jgi:hypothetical protein
MNESLCLPRYSDGEGPECPYCGCVHTADESHYFDEGGFEIDCNDCEREFKVWPNIAVSWRTESVPNSEVSHRDRERQPAAPEQPADEGLDETTCCALPDLWEEMAPGKVWARATKKVDGEKMGLKCELKLVGGKFRWMTLNPQTFGVADTLNEAIDQVESFLHNAESIHPESKP